MKIDGQGVVETDTHLVFGLRDPFFSAYKKYRWTAKEEGIGISRELIRVAYRKGKKIIAVYNSIRFEIAPIKIAEYYKNATIKPLHKAHAGVLLVVIPLSLFTKLEGTFNFEEYKKKESERVKVNNLF